MVCTLAQTGGPSLHSSLPVVLRPPYQMMISRPGTATIPSHFSLPRTHVTGPRIGALHVYLPCAHLSCIQTHNALCALPQVGLLCFVPPSIFMQCCLHSLAQSPIARRVCLHCCPLPIVLQSCLHSCPMQGARSQAPCQGPRSTSLVAPLCRAPCAGPAPEQQQRPGSPCC